MKVFIDGQEFVTAGELKECGRSLDNAVARVLELEATADDLSEDLDASQRRVMELEEYVEMYGEIKRVVARLLDAIAANRETIAQLNCRKTLEGVV